MSKTVAVHATDDSELLTHSKLPDHTFEIQLFTKLFKAGAKEVRRTERQLCDQLFPPEPNSINDRRTQLPRVTESDTVSPQVPVACFGPVTPC